MPRPRKPPPDRSLLVLTWLGVSIVVLFAWLGVALVAVTLPGIWIAIAVAFLV